MTIRNKLITIGIKKKIHTRLKNMRSPGQSFSGFIEELLKERKRNIKVCK